MRGLVALMLLVTLMLPAVPVAAEPVSVLEEAADDVALLAAGGATGLAGARYDALDLLSLDVEEREETIHFRLAVKDIDPAADVFIADDSTYYVIFQHNDQSYVVQIFRAVAEQLYVWGGLLKFDPDDFSFNYVRFVPVTADTGADVLEFEVLRQDITDKDGAAPFPGRVIDQFWTFSHLRINEGGFINIGVEANLPMPDAYDRMPDRDVAGELPIRLGLAQSGHAALTAAKPLRASNGEATTFVFTLTAHNRDDAEDVFEVTQTGAPSAWDVTIPDRYLRLGAGESVEIPIIVSTPFSHQHGSVQTFLVTMQSQSDPGSTGRMEVGVRYHEVPQPAGHHNQLWIHSQRYGEENPLFVITDNLFAGNGGFTFINTLQEDEQDQEVPVKGIYWGYGNHYNDLTNPVAMWRWFLFLQPGLEMGLDFDLDGTGTLFVPITTNVPLAAASMRGEIVHLAFDHASNTWTRTIVAHLEATQPTDLLAGASETFAFEFTATPAADLLEYQDRATFQVELNLSSARPAGFTGAEAPELIPGGTMTLPLFEYADPVDEAFTALKDVALVARNGAQHLANPGEAALVTLGLRSTLDEETTFEIEFAGTNPEWVTLLGKPRITVPSGQGRPLGLAFNIPADAPDGERADIIVTAKAVDNPTLRALVRVVVEADTDVEHEDATEAITGLSQSKEDAPGLPLVGLLAALAAAFVLRRRN